MLVLFSRVTARVLLAVGLLACGYAAYVAVDATRYQAVGRELIGQARHAPIAAVEPVDGSAIGEIRIERIGLAAVVAEGDSPVTLRRAVGHLAETPLPGSEGNVVLAGHRDTFFRPLKRIRAGDAITLTTSRGDFAYVVESMSVVSADDVEALLPRDGRTLTLVTCFPFFYVGSAPDRFIVRARQIDGRQVQLRLSH